MKCKYGFSLIELLIVIAIIAILALIAVPNFLEAQVRAKVSRAMADMRSIATALESYMVDYNTYPLNGGEPFRLSGISSLLWYYTIPFELTTPISYITTVKWRDPFVETDVPLPPTTLGGAHIHPFYNYHKIVTLDQRNALALIEREPPPEAVDECGIFYTNVYNCGAFEKYGYWKLLSKGPDREYVDKNAFPAPLHTPLHGSDIIYDPTNGTVSFGNIIRTQLDAAGVKKDN